MPRRTSRYLRFDRPGKVLVLGPERVGGRVAEAPVPQPARDLVLKVQTAERQPALPALFIPAQIGLSILIKIAGSENFEPIGLTQMILLIDAHG
jgi:hypothetical protein